MCLAVPGEVIRIEEGPVGLTMGTVRFGGITKEVCLACVPGVEVGDHVVVHAGFAIGKVDEHEAREVFRLLEELARRSEGDEAG